LNKKDYSTMIGKGKGEVKWEVLVKGMF